MRWVAGGLAFVAGMPQLGVAVFAVVVVVNGVFAFVQEHRAERAVDRLRDLLPSRVIVRRDGARHEIPSTALVRGDVVLLEVALPGAAGWTCSRPSSSGCRRCWSRRSPPGR